MAEKEVASWSRVESRSVWRWARLSEALQDARELVVESEGRVDESVLDVALRRNDSGLWMGVVYVQVRLYVHPD